MFVSFEKHLEDRSATLQVSLHGPKDKKPEIDYMIGPPAERHHRPFLRICKMRNTSRVRGDGLIVDLKSRVGALQTRDCWTVVIYATQLPIALLLHAGRMQLRPTKDKKDEYHGNYGRTIISEAMLFWQHTCHISIANTGVLLVKGICGEHFVHDSPKGRQKIMPFFEYFGEEVFADASCTKLDLDLVIRKMLCVYGIIDTQIDTIGACTYETAELSSLRRDGRGLVARMQQNLVTIKWT